MCIPGMAIAPGTSCGPLTDRQVNRVRQPFSGRQALMYPCLALTLFIIAPPDYCSRHPVLTI